MTIDITSSGASRESHKHPLYCVVFSTYIYVGHFEKTSGTGVGEEENNKRKINGDNLITQESIHDKKQFSATVEREVIYIDDGTCEHYHEVKETVPTNQPENDDMIFTGVVDKATTDEKGATSSGGIMSSFDYYHMATCGGNYLTLYQVKVPDQKNSSDRRGICISTCHNSISTSTNNICEEESEDFMVRQVYKDIDEEENYFTCIFAGRSGMHNPNVHFESHDDENDSLGPQLCCVGGKRGLIKVIDTVKQSLIFTLVGHTDELYDMKRCPVNEWLLLSASNDETIRLWNLKYPSQIAIFAGHQGHREAVLSVDWHPFGKYFASSGMDGTIRLWSVEEPTLQNAIKESFKSSLLPEETLSYFKTVYDQMPFWITSKMHTDYVDCIAFVGDLILSKSTTNIVSLWKPIFSHSGETRSIESNSMSSKSSKDKLVHLLDYSVPDCGQWYIRFGVDSDCNLLAVGNCIGDIRVWEIGGGKKPNIVFNAMCSSIVRMTAFSPDGQIMVAVCDDSTVWKYHVS